MEPVFKIEILVMDPDSAAVLRERIVNFINTLDIKADVSPVLTLAEEVDNVSPES
jgi:hypothetical protein